MHALLPRLAAVFVLISAAAPAVAQDTDRAIVLQDAPIMVVPDASRTPLRVAAPGTSLVVVGVEGDWLRVQFQDPQYGLRTGYVQAKLVRVDRAIPAAQPMDLSVPARQATPRPAGGAQVPARTPTAGREPQQEVPITGSPSSLTRAGFWFSAGLGFGTLGCETCVGRSNGASGGISGGGTISDRLLMGVGTTGWYRTEDGVWLTASTFDGRIRFYPSRTSGFFLNAGAGLGTVSIGTGSVSVTETGFGLMLGMGWDLRVGRNVSLTPFWNGSAVSASDTIFNFGQIGLGVTVH